MNVGAQRSTHQRYPARSHHGDWRRSRRSRRGLTDPSNATRTIRKFRWRHTRRRGKSAREPFSARRRSVGGADRGCGLRMPRSRRPSSWQSIPAGQPKASRSSRTNAPRPAAVSILDRPESPRTRAKPPGAGNLNWAWGRAWSSRVSVVCQTRREPAGFVFHQKACERFGVRVVCRAGPHAQG